MSNENFKSIKNVIEPLSGLSVSGDAVVHKQLEVGSLVAENIMYSSGKAVKNKTFIVELAYDVLSATTTALSNVGVSVIAAEVSFGASSGKVDVGTGQSATDIINTADSSPTRVSSVYSAALGTAGSTSGVTVAADGILYITRTGKAVDTVTLRVYYTE